jgi:hypothetical protein
MGCTLPYSRPVGDPTTAGRSESQLLDRSQLEPHCAPHGPPLPLVIKRATPAMGRIGYGMSEYLDPMIDGKPVGPDEQ